MAFPKRAYLVFRTFVFRPDRTLNLLSILRISVSCASGWEYSKNKLMSSANASISFEKRCLDFHGLMSLDWVSLRSSSSTQIMKRYPAIGSPCLQPRPTWILGVGNPLISIEDWKFFRRALIQCINLGFRLNHFRVLSMNSNEMLSKAFEKSICNIRPGRLLSLAC